MKYHIAYYGCTNGDFIRALILSGLNDIKTKFEDGNLCIKYDTHKPTSYWKKVIKVNSKGKIECIGGPLEIDDDRYRCIRLGDRIGKPINQVKHYLIECDNDVDKFQQYIFDYARDSVTEFNHWHSKTSISVGHEYVNFLNTFGTLKEFYTHIEDFRKVDTVIYITVNDKKDADQRWFNNARKNLLQEPGVSSKKGAVYPNTNYPNKDIEEAHLAEHLELAKTVSQHKRPQDLILPFRYIYNKEYLRKWISNEFDWKDWLFDDMYDAWYNKQTVIIDK